MSVECLRSFTHLVCLGTEGSTCMKKIRPFCSSVEAAELACSPVEEQEECAYSVRLQKNQASLNENVVTAVSLGT